MMTPHVDIVLGIIRNRYDEAIADKVRMETVKNTSNLLSDYDERLDMKAYPAFAQVIAVRNAMKAEGFSDSEINEIMLAADEAVRGVPIDMDIKEYLVDVPSYDKNTRPLSREMSDRLWARNMSNGSL